MPDEGLIGVSEIARLLGMTRPNAYKWVQRRGLEPVRTDPLPAGRQYSEVEVVAVRDAWLSKRDRGQDEKRRASAIARRER